MLWAYSFYFYFSMYRFSTFGRKLTGLSVATATVMWSLGLAAMPLSASAVTCPELASGRIVKFGSKGLPSYIHEGHRWEFTSLAAKNTWSTAPVKLVNAACADNYHKAGVVGYRPGSVVVKLSGAAMYFGVGPKNTLYEMDGQATVRALYGAYWRSDVRVLTQAQLASYTMGGPAYADKLHDGLLVKKVKDKTIYLVWDGQLRKVDGRLPVVARNDVRTVAASLLKSMPVGEPIKAADTANLLLLATGMGSMPTPPAPTNNVPTPTTPTDTTKPDTAKNDTKDTSKTDTTPDTSKSTDSKTDGGSEGMPTGSGMYRFKLTSGSDTDGWVKAGVSSLTVYVPPADFAKYSAGSAIFGATGYTWTFNQKKTTNIDYVAIWKGKYVSADSTTLKPSLNEAGTEAMNIREGQGFHVEQLTLNSGKPMLNLERIDLATSNDPADTKYSAKGYAEAYFAAIKNALINAPAKPGQPKTVCSFSEPSYETKTYGGNEWVLLTWIQQCQVGGLDGAPYKVPSYAVAKKPNGDIVIVYFLNSNLDLRKGGTNDLDPAKALSSDFIAQFLGKVKL